MPHRRHSGISTRDFDSFWAFNHAEAIRSFREGERLDSTCAMCSFGIALAYGPNINAPMPPSAADSALRGVQARADRARTIRSEIDLIDALAERYASTDSALRARQDTAYVRALRVSSRHAPRISRRACSTPTH